MKPRIFRYMEGKASEKEAEELLIKICSSEKAKKEYIEIKNFIAIRNAERKKPFNKYSLSNRKQWIAKCIKIAIPAFMLIITYTTGAYLYPTYRQKNAINQIASISDSIKKSIDEQEVKAVLVLENGSELGLKKNTAHANELSQLESTVTEKNSVKNTVIQDSIIQNMNIIKVTSKADYLLTLYDGSKVWLREGARFSFPSTFNSGKRLVQLDGEAYFNVAKDSLNPFIIQSGKMKITVLGTEFNLSANNKQHNTILSMFSGVVGLELPSQKVLKIRSNQEITVDSVGKYRVAIIDGFKYKARTQRYFMFIKEKLSDIVAQLEDWYGVPIKLTTNKYEDQLFTGKFSMDERLENIIQTLHLSYEYHFYLKDKIIYIE